MKSKFELGGLEVEVLGRQFPNEVSDYWDANWLHVKVQCRDDCALATHQGSILLTFEIEAFGKQIEQIIDGKSERARFEGIEPFLKISVQKSGSLGHILVSVDLSNAERTSFHTFQFDTDQTQLVAAVKDISRIIDEFPVREGGQ